MLLLTPSSPPRPGHTLNSLISSPPRVGHRYKAETSFEEWLEFALPVANLPRATRVIFSVLHGDDSAVGWGGVGLFGFNQEMIAGKQTIKLWPGACPTSSSTTLENKFADDPGELDVEFPTPSKPVLCTDEPAPGSGIAMPSVKKLQEARMAASREPLPRQVAAILERDVLYYMSAEDKELVWEYRYVLANQSSVKPAHVPAAAHRLFALTRRHPPVPHQALPKLLRAVDWANRAMVLETYALLHVWEPLDALDALQLLDASFPDPKVRAYAVSCLGSLDDTTLAGYMLQLTQVLKYEPFVDSALTRFLLRRTLLNTRILGHIFFWFLTAEMHLPDVRAR